MDTYLLKIKEFFSSELTEININRLTASLFAVISLIILFNLIFNNFISRFSLSNFEKIQTFKHQEEKREVAYIINNPFSSSSKNYLMSEVVIKVPETTLGLNLYGITYSGEGKISSAIMGFNVNEQKSYVVGEEIASGVVIDLIEKERVLISRNGQRESVVFNTSSLISFNEKSTSNNKKQKRIANLIPKQVLLSELFSFMPYFSNGNLKGYQIYPGTNKKLFHENGFKSGDIVLAVNGVPVKDPSVVNNLNSNSKTTIDLLRENQNVSIELRLNK